MTSYLAEVRDLWLRFDEIHLAREIEKEFDVSLKNQIPESIIGHFFYRLYFFPIIIIYGRESNLYFFFSALGYGVSRCLRARGSRMFINIVD